MKFKKSKSKLKDSAQHTIDLKTVRTVHCKHVPVLSIFYSFL